VVSVARVRRQRVAPWQHTLVILGILLLWAVYGAMRLKMGIVSEVPRWMRYAGQIMVLWLMTGTAVAWLYQRRRFLRAVFGRSDAPRDLGVGALVFLAGMVVMAITAVALKPLHLTHLRDMVLALAPHTLPELALWMLVSASAAVCEEFLFRGYLLRQFIHWLGSNVAGIVATAVLFGAMHLYEGTAAAIQIAALGALFAAVAVQRGTLRHVIVAHFLQDAFAGVMLFFRHT
jgi:membrane protease YdiL (CAAX protease family)